MKDLSPNELLANGTYLVDLSQVTSISLVFDFFSLLDLYHEGLKSSWKQLQTRYGFSHNICFDSLLCFILAHQLFKFPVSELQCYDVHDFLDLSENQQRSFRRQYDLCLVILQFLGECHLVDTVNKRYSDRFRDLVLKIQSREEILSQLIAKLQMANDPAIRSEKDLERKFFDLLVVEKMKRDQARLGISFNQFRSDTGGDPSHNRAMYRLKQLYRAISKNCHEVHSLNEGDDVYSDLNDLFIEASQLYNEIRSNESDYVIHYYCLLHILNKAILYRMKNGLQVSFIDFTGLQERQSTQKVTTELIQQTSLHLSNRALGIRSEAFLGFKIKNICNEDLAILHGDYLVKQCAFLDHLIKEKLEQIKICLYDKVRTDEKEACKP
jgi:hypothetical protein